MGMRADLVILAAIVGGSAYAVVWQSKAEPVPDTKPLEIGDQASDFVLADVGGVKRTLAAWTKDKAATVLYFWSTECPCVEAVEKRMKMLMMEFEPKKVEFIAIDSHPDDTAASVLDRMTEIHAGYRMLLDPQQRIAKRFGATKATEAVVLDASKRVRYRGGIDDSLTKPKTPFLRNALVAVLEGRDPTPALTETLGCPFPGFDGVCASAE